MADAIHAVHDGNDVEAIHAVRDGNDADAFSDDSDVILNSNEAVF